MQLRLVNARNQPATAQTIKRVVREEKLAGKGKLKVKMVLTGEGTPLNHAVEGEIDLSDAAEEPDG
jgi:Family of unknown function (DUF6494)